MLCEWKAKQKGLPSPMSEDDRSPSNESDQDALPPKGGPSLPGGPPPQGAPLPPGAPFPQGRPCPVGGPHRQDGPLPPNRPCPQGESHPPDGPFPLGGPPAPGRPFPPGRPILPTVPVPPSARENDGMSGGQGVLIRYHVYTVSAKTISALILFERCSGLMVSVLDLGPCGPHSRPWPGSLGCVLAQGTSL